MINIKIVVPLNRKIAKRMSLFAFVSVVVTRRSTVRFGSVLPNPFFFVTRDMSPVCPPHKFGLV